MEEMPKSDHDNTDIYFTKARRAITKRGDGRLTYGVFLRHDSICAISPTLKFLADHGITDVTRYYEEGGVVPAEMPIFAYAGSASRILELETTLLQKVGFACISAFNAYKMSMACPNIAFLDMHARHATGPEMVALAAYGASIGSRTAKLQGAKGFIGSSVAATSNFYGASEALGTMPHVLIGYAGSTLAAVQMFIDANPEDQFIVALVDYFGCEYTDAREVADWFAKNDRTTKTLGIRLDTHSGRFAEYLDYDVSIDIVSEWLHVKGRWPIVRTVMGEDAFDVADDAIRDGVAKILFGTGVSAASIINMRQNLDKHNHSHVKIVASSGFNLRKCKIMARAQAPIDMIGTGSFLPETLAESYATADCVKYDDKPSVKIGREWLLDAVLP